MAVAFDAFGPDIDGQTSTASTTLSWTHTNVSSGVALVVAVAMGKASDVGISLSAKLDPSGANTTIPTLGAAIHSDGGTSGFIQLFGLPNVSSGAHTITITAAGGTPGTMEGGSVSYTGADLTAPFSAQQSATGNSAGATKTFTGSTAGNMVSGAACCGSDFTAVTSGTSRWQVNFDGTSAAGNASHSDIAAGGSVALTWTNTSDWWAVAAVEVQATATSLGGPWFTSPLAEMPYAEKQAPWEMRGSQPPIPMQVWASPPESAAATDVPLSDTGAGDDQLSISAAAPLADTGTGVDALTVTAAASLADTAAGADSLSVAAALALADTASAADALTAAAAIPLTDTGAAADALGVTTTLSLTDTASASDSLTISAAIPLSDTAAAAEALAAGVPISLTDTATAVDALTITASVPLSDTAAADDSLSVFAPGLVDAYQAPLRLAGMFINPNAASIQLAGSSQVGVSGDQSISLADTATASDSLTAAAAIPLSDTASAADALAVTVALALADTASAVESLAAGVPKTLAETATATDALSVQITAQSKTLTETATATDALSITVALALADTASAVDAISIPEAPQAQIVSRVSTGHQMFRASTGTDARRVSTGHQMSQVGTGTDARRVSTGHQMSRISAL